jgi:hypothetical protein
MMTDPQDDTPQQVEPGQDVPLGMARLDWVAPADDDPAPRLDTGQFLDPDDGTPVWYTIPYRGPDFEYTAGYLRSLRGADNPPPVVGVTPPPETDPAPIELNPDAPGQQPEPPRNVTPDGVPHFLRLLPPDAQHPTGAEVCGGCGRDWPCPDAPAGLPVEVQPLADGRPAQRVTDMDGLAAMYGVDGDALAQVVERMRREQIERTGVDPLAGISQAEDEGRRYGV